MPLACGVGHTVPFKQEALACGACVITGPYHPIRARGTLRCWYAIHAYARRAHRGKPYKTHNKKHAPVLLHKRIAYPHTHTHTHVAYEKKEKHAQARNRFSCSYSLALAHGPRHSVCVRQSRHAFARLRWWDL